MPDSVQKRPSESDATPALRLPAEHGAWGMFLVPFACSAAVAGAWNVPLLLCAVCLLSLFLLRGSLEANRTSTRVALLAPAHLLLVALGGGAAGVLVFFYRRWELLGLALIALALYLLQSWLLGLHRQQSAEKRSLPAELVGVALASLSAPAVWIVARGELLAGPDSAIALDRTSVAVWGFNLLFFLGGTLYVKYRLRGVLSHRDFTAARDRLAFAWPVILYYALLAAFLIAWLFFDLSSSAQRFPPRKSAVLALAFAPGMVRTAGLLFHLGQRFPIRRLGWAETLHAIVFGLLLIVAFRWAA